ncbi:hypothetical protein PSECIP111854_01189 [Pseudoalteromonas sp. CIP111854]|uniref:Peptidase S9 prolyl oligopeptidase catalytic domain-containing protein n=1 Tax=Pseudoalteromonas holothuriae TaxID=2963714 RepID=A0A9W4QUP1_9GAMM|nr:alpha/beta fold hydrolase [Pseudoalteromonas sp. CIP111854]CAH9053534.1 hypothetical protein PSECIP111854_01189 [Pseudoalteromonas sp. CIP111854]
MRIIISFLIACNFLFSSQAAVIPADKLFSSPKYSKAKVSPNGLFLSITEKDEKNTYFKIINLETLETFNAKSFQSKTRIKEYSWLNDSKIHFKLYKNSKEVEYILAFTFKDNVKDTRFYTLNNGYMVDSLPTEPNHILYGRRNNQHHRLYKVPIDDFKYSFSKMKNAKLLDDAQKEIIGYSYDNHFERIITTELDLQNKEIIFRWRELSSSTWHTLFSYSPKDYHIIPAGFISEDVIAVLSNKNTDKVALHEFDIKTQTLGKVLFEHPQYDLIDAQFNKQGQLKSVSYYQKGVYTSQHFDLTKKKLTTQLKKALDNHEVYIIDSDHSNTKKLLYVNSASHPGAYYLYDSNINRIELLYESFPDLMSFNFAPSKYLSVTSKDGTKLDAFLTTPTGIDHDTLIVMPHGGPIGIHETDYFDPNIQYLANRGFSVLRVNFRGSAGYGKTFLQQGVGQFGQLIEQDITATVNQVLQSHQYKNVCAMGSSYGGYSSVMLAMKHPQQYSCVVAAYGIYDLPLLFNTSNYRSGDEYRSHIEGVVGKLDDSLTKLSPVYTAHKLQAPLLLIAGVDDEVSGIEQSNRFKFVLEQNNKSVDPVFYRKTGHGHSSWLWERHEAILKADFLYTTLGLKTHDIKTLNEMEKESLREDYMLLADSFEFGYLVEKDAKKSYRYYLKAAELEDARALFNIGSFFHRGQMVEYDFKKAMANYEQSANLGYASAHSRLGQLYMEGMKVERNHDKAYKYLTEANRLDDSYNNVMLLGRFFCTADEQYKNIDTCIEKFTLKDTHKLSNKKSRKVFDQRRSELAKAFMQGLYTPEEIAKLKVFMKETYNLTHLDFELDVEEAGIFEYRLGDKYRESGRYHQISDGYHVKGKNLSYGLRFTTDISGIDMRTHRTALIMMWTKQSKDGKSEPVKYSLLWGNPREDFIAIRSVESNDDNTNYSLQIYNLDKTLLYSKSFLVSQE